MPHYVELAEMELLGTLKTIFDQGANRVVYDDGQAILGALDVELLERRIHAVDRSFLPSRPDSAVDPCPHNCAYCRANDVKS